MRLTGKRVLVTAAAAGIGRASAEAAIAEGAEVFATDLDHDRLATLPAAETFRMDALDADDIIAAAERAQPDVLINCAGIVHHGTILDATDEEWNFALALNVTSMFRSMRAVLPGMIGRGGGSIVNIASVVSSITGAPNRAAYGASKGAVIGLTKSVAQDYVTNGIRCNAICPGTVDTPSLQERLRAGGDFEATRQAFLARQPMGRFGTANEIAALVIYLASDESAFVTGQTHVIDGGWTG